VKVGIIGAGLVTSGSHLPVLVNMPGVDVAWICDRSAATAASVGAAYGISRTYTDIAQCPDVDVVLVATPVGARPTVIPQALARGWHVFSEKPFAISLDEHDRYIADAERHGRQLGVGQVRRFARPTASARRLLQRDFLGPVLRVGAAEGFITRSTGRESGWHMTDPKAGGGVLMETGSHLVDQVLYVLGARDVALRQARQRRHRGLELASSLDADITLANGHVVPCSIELSMLDDLANGLFIEFPNYVLKVGLFFEGANALVTQDGEVLTELATSEGVDNPTAGFAAEWQDFLEQCRRNEPGTLDARSVRNTTALIEAAYQTAEADLSAVGAA
jgi:predicted dehydrogenase